MFRRCLPPGSPKFRPIPKTWVECRRTFNRLALQLHPDKPGGSGEAFKTISDERDAWYKHFHGNLSPSDLEYMQRVTADIREYYLWLSSHRALIIQYVRATCKFHRMRERTRATLPYERIFTSKVTLIDGVLLWLQDVLGRGSPDGRYISFLRDRAGLIIDNLMRIYLPDMKEVGEVKAMEDVIKQFEMMTFDFGDEVPILKPHDEHLDQHFSTTSPSTEPDKNREEVQRLQKQVEDLQGSIENITSQHNRCITKIMLDAKEEEFQRKFHKMQQKHDADMKTVVADEARIKKEHERNIQQMQVQIDACTESAEAKIMKELESKLKAANDKNLKLTQELSAINAFKDGQVAVEPHEQEVSIDPQEPQVQTEPKKHQANTSRQDISLPTARYKKQKVLKNSNQETVVNSTYPWISEYGLQAACNNSFFGNVPANVHVSAKRDYDESKGITVFFSEGRREKKVAHGYIHPLVLERQECKGMQKLTEFFRVGSTIAREKGGDAPNISAEEILKRINRSSE